MRYFSAQYVYTNTAPPLKRPVITTSDDGTIISIEDTGGNLSERHSVEFFNGIIVPGFINCHSHIELSYMHGHTEQGSGLAGFITKIRSRTTPGAEQALAAVQNADNEMFNGGIVGCGDVCNSDLGFEIKQQSRIKYVNFLEVYGADSTKAEKRITEVLSLSKRALEAGLDYNIVPHSVYSVSEPLFELIRDAAARNRTTSIHFLESAAEKELVDLHSGELFDSYSGMGIPQSSLRIVRSHTGAVLEKMIQHGKLILVHNTFISKEEIKTLRKRDSLFFCLCPGSNLFIENRLPPVGMLIDEECDIVLGTDSRGSNRRLSILNEMFILQKNFSFVTTQMAVRWATLNGAEALGLDSWAGSIENGKKPGLVLIEKYDLENDRLSDESTARRLI